MWWNGAQSASRSSARPRQHALVSSAGSRRTSQYPVLAPESRGETLIGFNLYVDGRAVTVTDYKAGHYTVVDDETKTATRRRGNAWLDLCGFVQMPIDTSVRVQLRNYGCIAEARSVQEAILAKVARGAYVACVTSEGKKRALLSARSATEHADFAARVTAQRAAASTPAAIRSAAQSRAPPTLAPCGPSCPFRTGGAGYAAIARAGRAADGGILRKRVRGGHKNARVKLRPPPKPGCPIQGCKALFKPASARLEPAWARCWCAVCNDAARYPNGCVYLMTGSLLVYEAKMSAPEGEAAYVARHSVQAAVRSAQRPQLGASPAVAASLARVDAPVPAGAVNAPPFEHRLFRLTHRPKLRQKQTKRKRAKVRSSLLCLLRVLVFFCFLASSLLSR